MHDPARDHSLALARTLGLDDAERALIMSRDQLAGTGETLAALLREIAAGSASRAESH
jgi:hypothetical protein